MSSRQVSLVDGSVKIDGGVFLSDVPSSISPVPHNHSQDLVLGASVALPVYHADLLLGKLHAKHLLADARNKAFWMTPEFGTKASDLPQETQFLLAQTHNGMYVAMCPLIWDGKFRATLQPGTYCGYTDPQDLQQRTSADADALCLHVSSGHRNVTASAWGAVLLIAAGDNPYTLLDAAVTRAAALSGGAKPRLQKVLPDSIDTFGWCTWDAFYAGVSAAGVEAGLDTLYQGGVPAKFLIIDDGWQRADVDPHLRVCHDREQDVEAQRAEHGKLKDIGEAYTGPHRPLHLHGDDTGRLCTFVWEPPPKQPKRGGVLARHVMPQRAQPPVRVMVSPSPKLHKGHLQRAEQVVPAQPDTKGPGTQAAPAPGGAEQHDVAAAINTLFGEARDPASAQEAREEAAPAGVAGTADGTQTAAAGAAAPTAAAMPAEAVAMPAAEVAMPASETAAARAPAEQAAAEPDSAGTAAGDKEQPTSTLNDILQTAAGAAGLEQLRPELVAAAAAAAAAEACAAAPPPRVHRNQPGPLDGVWHSVLSRVFSRVPRAWQPAVGKAVGTAEGHLVGLLHYLLKDADQDAWLVKLIASPYGGPVRDLLLRFYAATDDFSKRLTCPTANAKFGFVGATAAEGLRPESNASAIVTVPAPAEGADDSEDAFESESDMAAAVIAGTAGGRLLDVVSAIRKRYGVQRVYCWHSFFGYWSGISVHDPAFAALAPQLARPYVSPRIMDLEGVEVCWGQITLAGVGVTANPAGLYALLHGYLEAAGVDGVKVDVQSVVGLVASGDGLPDPEFQGGPSLAKAYQAALEESVARHFPGNHVINCMCHSTENLYRMSDTVIARCSDDFFPLSPASHTTHVGVCPYNALFLSPLVLPDWDMWQSRHVAALLHAVARVISGGPMYVSDRPGVHDFLLLRRVVMPDGSVLRPLLPGRPTRDCLFVDPMRDGVSVLKVWNQTRFAGLMGLFNVQGSSWSRTRRAFHTHDPNPPSLTTLAKPSDVEDVDKVLEPVINAAGASPSGTYALYSDHDCSLNVVFGKQDALSFELLPGSCDMITVVPLLQLELPPAPLLKRDSLGRSSGSLAHMFSHTLSPQASSPGPLSPSALDPRFLSPGPSLSRTISLGSPASAYARGRVKGRVGNEMVVFGVIGMLGMLNPSGAILHYAVVPSTGREAHTLLHVHEASALGGMGGTLPRSPMGRHGHRQAGARVELVVKGHGPLLLHSSRRPRAAVLDGEGVEFLYDAADGSVVVQVPAWRGSLNHEVSVEL